MVDSSEKLDTPVKWRTGSPPTENRVVPSAISPLKRISVPMSHSAGRPPMQYSQLPHDTRQMRMTWSPGCTDVTPAPTSSTTPDPSCPRMIGKGIFRSPFMTCRSLWHTPPAYIRTSTSPACGGATSISSNFSGVPAS